LREGRGKKNSLFTPTKAKKRELKGIVTNRDREQTRMDLRKNVEKRGAKRHSAGDSRWWEGIQLQLSMDGKGKKISP